MAIFNSYVKLPEGKASEIIRTGDIPTCGDYTYNPIWLVVFFLPLWKMMERKSVGMMKFPIYGNMKVMFQTTKQLW